MDVMEVCIADVVFRDDLYPRAEHDPALVQKYAGHLSVLPPIEVNQNSELIDGKHRWLAHQKQNRETLFAVITETDNDGHLLELAIERNATHGQQMTNRDKKRAACKIYADTPISEAASKKKKLAELLSVDPKTINTWVSDIARQRKAERDGVICQQYLACKTQEEIAEQIEVPRKTIRKVLALLAKLQIGPEPDDPEAPPDIGLSEEYWRRLASHSEPEFSPPLFDVWNWSKNANHKHYGNTHIGIVDNLLYTFTEPFDIVIDPFAGGGSTIDICKRRLRRYWVSDRNPIIERAGEIRKHDLTAGVSGPKHWGDVSLVYLDPPYWKQAAGQYSADPEDLANMPFDQFTESLVGIIHGYAKKIKTGSYIACIISPTQWPNEDKTTNYHDIDLACRVGNGLKLVRRAVCPYSTEQYNGTQVEIAKERKLWMILSRTLLVWEKQ